MGRSPFAAGGRPVLSFAPESVTLTGQGSDFRQIT